MEIVILLKQFFLEIFKPVQLVTATWIPADYSLLLEPLPPQ